MAKFNWSVPEGSHISLFKVEEVSRPGGDKFYLEGSCDTADIESLPGEDEDVCSGSNMIVADGNKIVVYSETNAAWGDWGEE